MKKINLLMITVLFFAGSVKAQIIYDSILAKKLGGNENGMKKYVLAILKTGPTTLEKGPKLDSLFAGHMKNITYLADRGLLAAAGPLVKNDKTYRGIFVMNVKTVEEAKNLCETDPAIKAGIFAMEFFEWYSSAALMEIPRIHKTIQKSTH